MSKSTRLRLRDMRDIYRLIGECRDRGDDPTAWRTHLFAGLCRITGAQVGVGGGLRGMGATEPEKYEAVDIGWAGETERAHWLRYYQDGRMAHDVTFHRFGRLKGRLVTCARERLSADLEWYASIDFNEYRRLSRIDGWMVSSYRLDEPGVVNLITLHRSLGGGQFSRRDCRLVHLLHHELGPLIGSALATRQAPLLERLSPRLRQTLQCLLRGDSEKEAARELGLGVRTVHGYVTALYRHFGVHSRAELMVCCLAERAAIFSSR